MKIWDLFFPEFIFGGNPKTFIQLKEATCAAVTASAVAFPSILNLEP